MATIALYATKVNQMPELVQGIKSAVNDYKTELQTLQMKALSINTSVCNLDDVISSIQSSTQTQDDKISSFDTLEQNTEEFIETAVSVDSEAADMINQQRAEFYEEYAYLKPECEKNTWDKFCDGCKSVGEWCKEHWVKIVVCIAVAAVCIVVGAVLTALTGGSFLAAVGAGLVKALIGGVMSGLISAGATIISAIIKKENVDWTNVAIVFLDGFVTGFAISGAFAGISMSLSSGARFMLVKNLQNTKFLVHKGTVSESFLKWLTPKGVKNTFFPTENIRSGYKYIFKVDGVRVQLKWHAPDLNAASKYLNCNSGAGWTAQLQFGKKLLSTMGTLVNKPDNITHIPIISWFKWR